MKIPMFFVLALAATSLQAQTDPETECDDLEDNDHDGRIDCVDDDCPCSSSTWSCADDPVQFVQIIGIGSVPNIDSYFMEWDGSGAFTPLNVWNGGNSTAQTNAIGYNIENGYIYGIKGKYCFGAPCEANKLVQIKPTTPNIYSFYPDASHCVPWGLPDIDPGGQRYVTGDCDLAGHLYVTTPNKSSMWSIDLHVVPTPYDHTVATEVPLTKDGLAEAAGVSDWAFVNQTQLLYGVHDNDPAVLRSVSLTGEIIDLPITGDMTCATGYGAAWSTDSDPCPRLYFYCNGSGRVVRLEPEVQNDYTSWVAEEVIASGTVVSYNDGASCALSQGDPCIKPLCEPERRSAMVTNPPEPAASRTGDDLLATAGSVLHQNKPNPFDEATVISYEMTDLSGKQASISIFRLNGDLVRTYPVAVAATGNLTIDAGTLQPGMYLFTMVIDDKEIDTKRMIMLE